MKARALPGRCRLVLAAAAIALLTGCVSLFDRIADTVLANEVRFDDRELPPTAYAIPASADAIQLLGGQGSGLGCSLPPGAQYFAFKRHATQAPIALQMRQACAFHDYCYRHGNATYGYSQADCDFLLQQHAFRLCKLVNENATISACETNARKVTLGVRLGGFGSFRRARSGDDDKASTFFEFDPYPVRATSFKVVRIADAPTRWVRRGVLPKAAYHFDIRPSGTRVHVIGWKPDGRLACAAFDLPASYNAINGVPIVVRMQDSQDWFVWWQRHDMGSTQGRFALLPPGKAQAQDWQTASGGFTSIRPPDGCEAVPLASDQGETTVSQLAAFRTGNVDQGFSELHAAQEASVPGTIRLLGLSTNTCDRAKTDRSPCLVDVEFDTIGHRFRSETRSPNLYRASETNCDTLVPQEESQADCDRYRNYVTAPIVTGHQGRPSALWVRRGSGSTGDGYDTSAFVRRFVIGEKPEDPASDLGELQLPEFTEAMDPPFVLNGASARPSFLSIPKIDGKAELHLQASTSSGEVPARTTLTCPGGHAGLWLNRPPALILDPTDAKRSHIVFSRVQVTGRSVPVDGPTATLAVTVVTLDDGVCSHIQSETFTTFFNGFASSDEVRAAARSLQHPDDASRQEALDAMDRFSERVRSGQMVVADITGDGVPDLLQIAQSPKTKQFASAMLVGEHTTSGLRFRQTDWQRQTR